MNKELKAQHSAERKLMKAALAGDDSAFDRLAEITGSDGPVELDTLESVDLEIPADVDLDEMVSGGESVEALIERLDAEYPCDGVGTVKVIIERD